MPMNLSPSQRIAFAKAMEKFAQTAVWGPPVIKLDSNVSMEKAKPMYKWMHANSAPPNVCNCWEAVLIAGLNAGLWDKNYVRAAISLEQVDVGVKVPQLTRFMQTRLTKSMDPNDKDGGSWSGFVGNIVMIGYEGQHFAVSGGGGTVIELDKPAQGKILLSKVLERSPYNNKVAEVYISDPPTAADLEDPQIQRR